LQIALSERIRPNDGARISAEDSGRYSYKPRLNDEMGFDRRLAFQHHRPCLHRSRIVRHEDQKSLWALANTESQTQEEKGDTYSTAGKFTETKESLTESLANAITQEQIKAKKRNSHANTHG
jgi:hypothetical protein